MMILTFLFFFCLYLFELNHQIEIAMEMQTILKGLIGGAPSNWEQMMREQLASPELMQFLKVFFH